MVTKGTLVLGCSQLPAQRWACHHHRIDLYTIQKIYTIQEMRLKKWVISKNTWGDSCRNPNPLGLKFKKSRCINTNGRNKSGNSTQRSLCRTSLDVSHSQAIIMQNWVFARIPLTAIECWFVTGVQITSHIIICLLVHMSYTLSIGRRIGESRRLVYWLIW